MSHYERKRYFTWKENSFFCQKIPSLQKLKIGLKLFSDQAGLKFQIQIFIYRNVDQKTTLIYCSIFVINFRFWEDKILLIFNKVLLNWKLVYSFGILKRLERRNAWAIKAENFPFRAVDCGGEFDRVGNDVSRGPITVCT